MKRISYLFFISLICVSKPGCVVNEVPCNQADVSCDPALWYFLPDALDLLGSEEVITTGMFVSVRADNRLVIYDFEPETGTITPDASSPILTDTEPIGLCKTPDQSFLYLVTRGANAVYGYSIDSSTGGVNPTPLGSLGAGTQPWACMVDSTGKWLYVSDVSTNLRLQSIDSVTGSLTAEPVQAVGVNGAQQMLFNREKDVLFVSGTNNSPAIAALSIDQATGNLATVGGSPFASGNFMRQVALSPDESFFYASSRNSGNVSLYSNSSGALSSIGTFDPDSSNPVQAMTLSPDGKYLYTGTLTSNLLQGFSVNTSTGAINNTPVFSISMNGVQNLYFEPMGRFLIAICDTAINGIRVFEYDDTSGNLTEVSGSPFDPGDSPFQAEFFTETR